MGKQDLFAIAALPVDHLAEPDVTPGEAVGVVEGGDGPDLPRLVGVEPPADGGAGPPLRLVR